MPNLRAPLPTDVVALLALVTESGSPVKRLQVMKRLKRRVRCPIPLNGMDCQFPYCGSDLPPDEPEATAELQKIVATANVPVTHCPPAKASSSKRMTAGPKLPSSSVRSLRGMETSNTIPYAFVWTKIGDEGGQSVKQILNRKELVFAGQDQQLLCYEQPVRVSSL
jgi:hypothetical protein